MVTGAINEVLVFGGPILDACLCVVMVRKSRWRTYPALFLLAFLDLVSSIVLYLLDPLFKSNAYRITYLAFDVASFALQLAILFEIASNVLKAAGIWRREAFKPLLIFAGTGAALAFLATFSLSPLGIHGQESMQLKADMFTGLLTCEIVVAMLISSKEVGLPWRSHVMAVGQGLMVYMLAAVLIEGFEAYLGPKNPYYANLYYIRSMAYLVTLSYWSVALWREEPVKRPVSPALRKYIVALHKEVQYDLGKAGH